MADESRSLEDVHKAIDEFDEKTGKMEDLQALQNEAEELEKAAVQEELPVDTPAPEPESQPEPTPPEAEPKPEEPKPEEKPEEQPSEPAQPTEEQKQWTVKKDDLPEGYDTAGHVFKAFGEQRETLDRQTDFIKKQQEQIDALTRQYQDRQAQPESQPASQPASETPAEQIDFDKQIQEKQVALGKAREEDPFSADAFNLQTDIENLRAQSHKAEIEAVKQAALETSQKFEQYQQSREQDALNEKNQQTLENDYKEIDAIGKEKGFEDYVLNKPAKEIEQEYLAMRDAIVKTYYGREPQNVEEVNNAMQMYRNKAPDLMGKLIALQIPVEFSKDINTYIEACKMLNYRDGVTFNEKGEQVAYRKRYDPVSQTEIADRFHSLKEAIEQHRISTGVYKKKEIEAYDKGTKDMREAMNKRDTNELGPGEGKTVVDTMTLEDMIRERDSIKDTDIAKLPRLQELNDAIERQLTIKPTA
jgi:hypothetical protein